MRPRPALWLAAAACLLTILVVVGGLAATGTADPRTDDRITIQ